MNKFKIGIIFLVLVLAGLLGCSNKVETITETVNSKDLQDTQITSILQEKIPEYKNLIYCSTFQLAWNELQKETIKEPIQLENQPPEVNYLNQGLVTKNDLSAKDYVAMAGFGKDKVVDKINQELKTKFGNNAEHLSDQYKDRMILAYAFLLKQIEFKYHFDALEEGTYFGNSNNVTKVLGFGIKSNSQLDNFNQVAEQVSIYDYQDPDHFVIKLATEGKNDELVLAKVQPRDSLLDTYQYVQKRTEKDPKQSFNHGDYLAIPQMDFKIRHTYENLLNKPFENKDFKPWYFGEAWQTVKFSLNEKGVALSSEALTGVMKGMTQPKSMFFDRPFLLYIKEKTARYPYLILWINNPELLIKEVG